MFVLRLLLLLSLLRLTLLFLCQVEFVIAKKGKRKERRIWANKTLIGRAEVRSHFHSTTGFDSNFSYLLPIVSP